MSLDGKKKRWGETGQVRRRNSPEKENRRNLTLQWGERRTLFTETGERKELRKDRKTPSSARGGLRNARPCGGLWLTEGSEERESSQLHASGSGY